MKRKAIVQVMALSGLIAAGAVAAEARGKDHAALFEAMDTDNNGSVTVEELQAHAAARFADADADGDGFLTPDEMRSARAAWHGKNGTDRAAKMLERHDTDGNGMLDKAELEAAGDMRKGRRGARMMKWLDTNADGKLDLAEITARRDPADMLARLDADGDGALSAEEFAKARHGKRRGE